MRIREAMARNLRLLCSSYPSRSDVARKLGISRQQLNKYLQGEVIPAERIIVRLSTLFGVSETDLIDPNFHPDRAAAEQKFSPAMLQAIRSTRYVNLSEGWFDLYLTVPTKPDVVVRTLVTTKRVDGVMEFRRVTSYQQRRRDDWKYYRGDHYGIVLQAQRALYLCGVNRISVFEPTLIVLEQAATSDPVYSGYGTVTGLEGPVVTMAVMVPNECSTLREAVGQIGAAAIHADETPSIVGDHIQRLGTRLLDQVPTERDTAVLAAC